MNWVVGLVFFTLLGSYFYYDWQDSYRVVDHRYISGTCKENHARIPDEYQGEIVKLHNEWENRYRYDGHLQRLYYVVDIGDDLNKLSDYETPMGYQLFFTDDYSLGDDISDVRAISNGGWYWGGNDDYQGFNSRCFLHYIKESELKEIRFLDTD